MAVENPEVSEEELQQAAEEFGQEQALTLLGIAFVGAGAGSVALCFLLPWCREEKKD